MPLYLGTKEIDIPFSKAYLGDVLKYEKINYIDTPFSSCPFPTSWTTVTTLYEYKSSNSHGEWIIKATGSGAAGVANRILSKVFDGKFYADSTSSFWLSADLSSDSAYSLVEIDCPILIKPSIIVYETLTQGNDTNKTKLQGYNTETSLWEDIHTLERVSDADDPVKKTISISNDKFYSKFRFLIYRYSSFGTDPRIYEFQITSGTIRKYS